MRRRVRDALVVLLAVLLVACGQAPVAFHGKDITGVMPDLRFRLTDENGRSVTAQDYAGKVTVLFFGYTHCPDFCPATLSLLGQALQRLPEGVRDDYRVLFVSVDPQRDTPALLKRYTAYFGPQVVGLTGTAAQLDAITKRYRTTYSYEAPDEKGDYLVSHGLAMYGFDRRGRVHLFMRNDQPVAAVAEDLLALGTL